MVNSHEEFARWLYVLEEDTTITDDTISKKNYQQSNLYTKYYHLLVEELKEIERLTTQRDIMYAELNQRLRYPSRKNPVLINGEPLNIQIDKKSDIDVYVNMFPEYTSIRSEISKREMYAEFFVKALKRVENMGHVIRAGIDAYKMRHGIMQ